MGSTYIQGDFLPIILNDLNKPWEKVLELGTPVSFPPRSIIPQREASSGTGMYLLRGGLVKLSYISLNGKEKTHFYIGPNTLFHEVPMFFSTRIYTFTCMESTEIVFFPKKLITADFVRRYPELFLNMLESSSIKSIMLYAALSREHTHDSFAKVCHVLYCMHLFSKAGDAVVPHLAQQELAAFLGIHRSSLHKALRRLHDEGVIGVYRKKELPIYDAGALLKYATE